MRNNSNNVPKAVQDCHEFLKWLIPQLDKFPRVRRFTLGERIETQTIQVLEDLVSAAYSHDKQPLLDAANNHIELLRYLWRLCHKLEVISLKRYEYGIRQLDDLGRQVGGWRKAHHSKR